MASETSEALKVDGEGGRSTPPDELKRELEEQFNVQRARMKELFLQKEEDMARVLLEKQQLQSEVLGLRAELQQLQVLSGNQQSEIQNLQLLVSETVEASSSSAEELRRLRARCLDLEQDLAHSKQHLAHSKQLLAQQHQEMSLAPATLVRSLARKLGADTDDPPGPPPAHLQPPRKNVEDGELMQSIIKPLEMEITALKNKLRENDAKLQEALKSNANATSISSSGDTNPAQESGRQCDMCVNYEKQLVAEQTQAQAAREKAARLDQALKLATEELEGVRSLHDETVRQWHSSRSESATQLEELRAAVEESRNALQARTQEAQRAAAEALEKVAQLTVDRQTLHAERAELERDNAILLGLYTKKAAEMQNEIINLPDSVPELQELTLQLREQLIECAIGRERALAAEDDLRSQLLEQSSVIHRQEAEVATVRQQLADAREELDRLQTEREQMKELGDKLRHSNDMIESLLEDKKRFQSEVSELRSRVSALQTELDNSEKVQQDFVRLSQSLQVQLQRIREADTEVRWQHDEDVSECTACRTPLPTTRKKIHCRHCGRIFCAGCVSHTVASGPRGLPARVCAVCRTLLQPHTAPYFSTQPPTQH